MFIKLNKIIVYSLLLVMPTFVLAQSQVAGLLMWLTNFLYKIFYVLMGVAFVVFIWGIIKFISARGDEKKISDGRKLIFYGVIGLFFMVTVFGFVYLLSRTLGFEPGGTVEAPGSGYFYVDDNGDFKSQGVQKKVVDCEALSEKPLAGLHNIACFISYYLSFIPPLFLVLALIYFVSGIINFMKAGNTDEKNSAKNAIVYGILAIFVIVGVWGLVWLVKSSLGL